MRDDFIAGKFRNVIRGGMAQNPGRALDHILSLPGARQDPDPLSVVLAKWEQHAGPIEAEPESRQELRKRLLVWAQQEHPQLGMILKALLDLYPHAINVEELAAVVEVLPDPESHREFGSRLYRLQTLDLLVLDETAQAVRAPDNLFRKAC